MMRLILRAIPAVSVLAVAAFANADITGPTPLAWRWAESAKVSPSGAPQFHGDDVVVAVGGRIYSLNKATGNMNWRFPAGESIAGSFDNGCTIAGELVIAGADEKSVYAVDVNTGQLKWQYVSPEPVTSNVAITKNNVVFVTNKQSIRVIDINTGTTVGTPFKEESIIHDDVAIFGDQLIYTTQRGKLASFDANTGKNKWEQRLNSLKPSGNFTVYNDRIYVNSANYLICLRAGSGSVVFNENAGKDLSGKPAANDSSIATLTSRGELLLYNTSGRAMFGKGIDIGIPLGSPSFVGNNIALSTANGAINLIDPKAASIIWSYVIAPITTTSASNAAGQGGTNGPAGDGDGGPGGAGIGGGGNLQTQPTKPRTYTLVAGTPAMSGNSLFVLTQDASLLMFDKDLGVDLTPPTVDLLWPTPGNEIAGKAPMEMIFKLEDLGIGINPDSVKVTINGKEYVHRMSNDGYVSVLIISRGANAQIANGRATISVTASDWLGNKMQRDFSVKIDNTLPPLGSPPKSNTQPGGAGGPAGGGGRGPSGGGATGGG
ncbi:MAG: PQQ-binding-like beta-propeller repeat protein [Fimbriimonadaceae bacterium]